MALKLVTPSVVDVVPMTVARAHMRVDHSDDDTVISLYIKAAINHIEGYRGIGGVTLGQATWEQYHDAFPDGPLKLLQRPLISIDKVEYLSPTTGNYTEWPDTNYSKDLVSFNGWVVPAVDWPEIKDAINAVKITFKAGFGSATESIPESIRVAVLLLAAHWYENRETVGNATDYAALPHAVDALIGAWREIKV